jgi:thioredoxin reductase (NADPH)
MKFIWDTVVKEVKGEDKVNGVVLENIKTGETYEHETDGVFIFIGHIPNTQMFEGVLDMEDGTLDVNRRMETKIPGVFAAGEAADNHFKQVITSAGMGAAAAMQANKWLEEVQDDEAVTA